MPSACGHVATLIAMVAAVVCLPSLWAEPPVPSGGPADVRLAVYSGKIRPLLAERCFSCHGGLKQEAGLRLDTVALMLEGGESGAVVVKGDSEASLILERVSDPDPVTRMPPEGEGEPLSAEPLAMLKDWIKAGCPAPADEKPEADPKSHWAFQPRVRPEVPAIKNAAWVKNPIDAFLAEAYEQAGVTPQPEPPRNVLIRRVYLDLIGLPPQPEELAAIEADTAADWYEKLVDKLLADPRHGERWGRHWMDIWRYSDWWGLGQELRYSQKHMWHYRDWIIESINNDLPYDEMVRQMLAADEIYPDDPAKLRATGFLARNWFLFNRTPWMDETVEHVGKGLLGLTMNCSKCHDHKYDPVSQEDFYKMRAFFEPISVRLDVVPGEADLEKNGIPRVYDGLLDTPTYLFVRGEDTKPDTTKPIQPGVPDVIAFKELAIEPITLPKPAFEPERRPWVLDAHVATARRAVESAEAAAAKDSTPANQQALAVAKAELAAVEKRTEATRAAWSAADSPSSSEADPLGKQASELAKAAVHAERELAVAKAWGKVAEIAGKVARVAEEKKEAASVAPLEKELATARKAVEKTVEAVGEADEKFTPLVGAKWTPTRFKTSTADDPPVAFPATSTGRRRALADWIVDPRNPLTARVAVNHIWMRHIGKPLVSTVFDFGRKGNAPTHPALLDWLASELVEVPAGGKPWSMKHLHRLIVTSAAYRMGSTTAGAEANLKADPDNQFLWRREPTRLESQVVRDCILALAGTLDSTMGGPSIPVGEQSKSHRRSVYFWHSDIDRNPFLTMFDDATVKECYKRDQSIVPQQALALSNAAIVHDSAGKIAERMLAMSGTGMSDEEFLDRAFVMLLDRSPSADERAACAAAIGKWRALGKPAGATADLALVHMVWALLNHNDFVTLR
jgi:hypothetical protein